MVCTWGGGLVLNRKTELVGRELEVATIDAFLGAGRSGGSRALLIVGEAGAGKTVLWRNGVGSAQERGYRTLVARPVEIETTLSFAGLVDLLEPSLEEALGGLPQPQRHALEVAFLLKPAREAPDRRELATAFLNALRVLSAHGPLLVAIDDLQWLDAPSHNVLAFAGRRLSTEPVALLLTRRVARSDLPPLELELAVSDRLERIRPDPLSLGALHRLLQLNLGHPLSRPLVRRLREVSAGNPFFTLELARALGKAEASGSERPLPVPRTLRSLVHDRLDALPASERELLLAAAALSHPTLEVLRRAAGRAGVLSLERSLEAEVIEIEGDRVGFTHPLLGSILYADASPSSRRLLHGRLAEIVLDPEESVRHLALTTDRTDPEIASRLEEAAEVARARGAPDGAADLLARAVELTPADDLAAHRRRRLAAADCWTDAGDASRALLLLQDALAVSASGDERAAVLARLAWIRCRNAGFRDGSALFDEASREEAADPEISISIEKGLAWADQLLGSLAEAEAHARNAVALAEAIGDVRITADSLADLGFVELLRGREGYEATMRRALTLEAADERGHRVGHARWLDVHARWLNTLLLAWTDRLDEARASLIALRSRSIEVGDEHSLPYILNWLGRVECYADDWGEAAQYAQESREGAAQAGLDVELTFALGTSALALAHLGDAEASRQAIDTGLELAERLEVVPAQLELGAVKGFLELSLGRFPEAGVTLAGVADRARAAGFAQPAVFRFHPDLVETALVLGDLAQAKRAAAELQTCAARLKSPWTRALSARCDGLLAAAEGNCEAALDELDRALVEHERLPGAFERGRTHLHRGIVLRRLKRKREARQSIETGLQIFEKLGSTLWADRARAECARISGTAPATSNALTETERRIAELVAAGHANKQVAAELFVTVRTIESNLTRIYRKLGVRSRGQLASHLENTL